MSLHDAYARRTPYEMLFPDGDAVEDLIAAIDEEAAARGAEPNDPHAFVTMGAVARCVRALQGADPTPGTTHRYGSLVYHAVHFARAGCPLFLLSTHASRYLVEGAPGGEPRTLAPAGYLQFPQHLFWAEASGVDRPESVDGMFWTTTASGVAHLLLVAGVRPDRAGLAVVPLPEAPIADAPAWLDADVREGGRDFASNLPGAELDRLYSFESAGEGFKLLGRFFAYAHGVPASLESREAPAGRADADAGPEPSTLPFTRVTLDA